jgi:RNA polymerase sigma-70 factor (ECF subfamily)
LDREREKEMVRGILAGRSEALEQLAEAYQKPVYNLAARLLGPDGDAEEAAQEAFVRILSRLDRYDQRKPLFPWVYTVALNAIRNHRRNDRRRLVGRWAAVSWRSADAGPERDLIRREDQGRLLDRLDRLPDRDREAVVLRYLQDLDYDDLARIWGVSKSGARMRVFRGLDRLRALMDGDEDEP